MASKTHERFFVDRMVEDLGWSGAQIVDGDEPPDFYIALDGRRIAVEVTRIYRREHPKKGSPEAAQEAEYLRWVTGLRDQYFAGPPAQPIRVAVYLPPPIGPPVTRYVSHEERAADLANVARRALARLRHQPPLAPFEGNEFSVRQADGRPAKFFVTAVPSGHGFEKRWTAMNVTIGWRAKIDPDHLQRKIDQKSKAVPLYRTNVASSVLLIVADDSRASGFLDLPQRLLVDAGHFDAVYFRRMEGTTRLTPEGPGR